MSVAHTHIFGFIFGLNNGVPAKDWTMQVAEGYSRWEFVVSEFIKLYIQTHAHTDTHNTHTHACTQTHQYPKETAPKQKEQYTSAVAQ